MKKGLAVVVSLIAILAMVGAVMASGGPPGTGWFTGITIQNVDPSTTSEAPATIHVEAYGSDSSTPSTAEYLLTLYEAKTLLPTDFAGMGSNFSGGGIVSSDKAVRAIVNVTNRYLVINGQPLGDPAVAHSAAAQYQGTGTPGTKLRFPLVKNDYFGKTTTFYVQNAGSASTTATATFVVGGVSYTYTTPTLQVGQTAVISPSDARNGGQSIPTGATGIGSLTVQSNNSQNLAGAFLEHKTAEVRGTLLQATRSFTDADADTRLFVPTNKDNYVLRFTGINVMNIGPGPVNVRITYTTTSDGACTQKNTTGTDSVSNLAEGAAYTFASDKIPGDQCMASAVIEVTSGSGKILGVVNESFTPAVMAANPSKYQESVTSYAFAESSATRLVSLPIVKEDSFDKASGINILNVTNSSAQVTITLKGPKGTFKSKPFTLAGQTSRSFLDMRLLPASFWDGTPMTPAALGCSSGNNVCKDGGQMSATISSTQNIVVIVNESTYPIINPRLQQDKNNYEGFNLPNP